MEAIKSSKKFLQSMQVQAHIPTNCRWWSKYIFHFSHITNIATILNDGLLKCRNQVLELENEELNDNASREVIDGTEGEYKDYVRFYFRPLTPTQFHNEGIRAIEEITHLGAHCPVPVFLLFDTAILDEPDVYFSYESLASHYHVPLYQGIEYLKEAPFNYIYHNESTYNLDGTMIRKHRQAEVVVKDNCDLSHLQKIVCRTEAEAETLKYMLDVEAFINFSDKIYVIGDPNFDTVRQETIFHGDYLKLVTVTQNRKQLVLNFNKQDTNERKFEVYWYDMRKRLITEFVSDQYNVGKYGRGIAFNLGDILKNYDRVFVEIKLDNHLVYCNTFYI